MNISAAGAVVFGGASGLGEATIDDAVAHAREAPGGLRISVVCAGIGLPTKLLGRKAATVAERRSPLEGLQGN